MKHLCISGGGSEIPALAGACSRIMKEHYDPDMITGVSSGAILTAPLALGMHETIKELSTNVSLDRVFSVEPLGRRGNISLKGILRILQGKPSIGSMGDLRRLYMDIITKEDFIQLQKCGRYVGVLVTNMNRGTGAFVLASQVGYEDWVDYVIASASVPVFAPPVTVGRTQYLDGGVVMHNPSNYILNKYSVTSMVEVYARSTAFGYHQEIKNVGNSLENTINHMTRAISELNSRYSVLWCKHNHTELAQVFTGNNMESLFDFNNERLEYAYLKGEESAKQLKWQNKKKKA